MCSDIQTMLVVYRAETLMSLWSGAKWSSDILLIAAGLNEDDLVWTSGHGEEILPSDRLVIRF